MNLRIAISVEKIYMASIAQKLREQAKETNLYPMRMFAEMKGIPVTTVYGRWKTRQLWRPNGEPGYTTVSGRILIYGDAEFIPPKQVQIGNSRKQLSKD